jgi:PmbA protein
MENEHIQEIAERILKFAKEKGASQAEVGVSGGNGFTVNVRLGEIETLEYHRNKELGVTVYFGQQMGMSSTTDINPQALENAVDAACSIAKATGSDPCHGLAEAELMARHYPELDLFHPWKIEVNEAIEMAKQCETFGRDYDSRITNSDGAAVTKHEGAYLYANSHGFMGHYTSSRHSLSCVLLAESPGRPAEKERDYEFTTARDPKELSSAQFIGEKAAQKTIARLEARKLSTRQTPVVFAPHLACGILGHFAAAIRGSNLYRQSSFLLDTLDKKIFPDFVQIEENPHILKALGSAPFDGEGVATRERVFVERGILKSYLLDSYAARKLGMQTTGNAGGVRNFQIKPTDENLLKKMGTGLLVTELMGQGVNIVTGDYSRGASGFWIENGEIAYPVHEITIAGHLKEMFLNLVAIGHDVDKRGSIWSGSLLFEKMMVAGE